MDQKPKIALIMGESQAMAIEQFHNALANFQIGTAVFIQDMKKERIETLLADFKIDVDLFTRRMNMDTMGDSTSYVPRFGVFNTFLHTAPEALLRNLKPFRGYFKPLVVRKQFMQLSTFANLRF